jgi:predicted glycosyltransferase
MNIWFDIHNSPHRLLLGLRDHVRVTVLPRGRAQAAHYRAEKFKIRMVDTAVDLEDIAPDCDLFIGAGETTTREMAVLGLPTVSIYRSELLEVDRYMMRRGCMQHRLDLDAGLRSSTTPPSAVRSTMPPNLRVVLTRIFLGVSLRSGSVAQ